MRIAIRHLPLAVCIFFSSALLSVAELSKSRIHEIAGWLPEQPRGPGWRLNERRHWVALSKDPQFSGMVAQAEKLLTEPIPEVTDETYLDFSQTGNRDRHQGLLFARSARLMNLALAECIDNKGRFLPALEDLVEATCSEKSWVYPAHDAKLDNFHGRAMNPDLRAAHVAWDLATLHDLLGEKLSPKTQALIRQHVEQRVLQPFRDMVNGRRSEVHWLRAQHNWNAVCLAGTVNAALALVESREDRALFVAAGEHYIQNFLAGFTPDGNCSEGILYWNYGFGHFINLAETIRQSTKGNLDLFALPAAMQPALYATRTEILNGIYPSISDSSPGARPAPHFVRYVCQRLAVNSHSFTNLSVGQLRSLADAALWIAIPESLPVVAAKKTEAWSPLRSWFSDAGLLICRPPTNSSAEFAVAIKGGHNNEFHNHNDVGSFIVVHGKTMLVCDPGKEVYTARTFGPQRYVSKVINSYGHAVPVVAGKLQRGGANAKAVVIHTEFTDAADSVAFDLRSAYAVDSLQTLNRSFTFRRGDAPSLTVKDKVIFSETNTFETALITWGDFQEIGRNTFRIRDGNDEVQVAIDTGGLAFNVKTEILDENVLTPTKPKRVAFSIAEPITKATISLVISPASAAAGQGR